MVLGSQSGRRNAGGVYSGNRYRKRRRTQRNLAVGAVVVLGGGVLVWSMVAGGDEPSSSEAGADPQTASVAGSGSNSDAAPGEASSAEAEGSGPTSSSAGQAAEGTPSGDPAGGEAEPYDSLTQRLDGEETGSAEGAAEPGSDEDDAGSMPEGERVDTASASQSQAPSPDRQEDQRSSGAEAPAELQSGPEVAGLIRRGRELIEDGQPIQGRRMLSDALRAEIAPADARAVRAELSALNEKLIFSPEVHPDDPLTETYVVQSGDRLDSIADQYNVPHQFIARINDLEDPNRLQVGWRLKVVNGPFDAVVHKDAFRLDVFLSDVYIRSFEVGLGEHNSTPLGRFAVKTGSKLSNPEWTNPRTGERVLADDPENPLGEYWIGLRGTDEKTSKMAGYGIHGTIEPETIGTEASMGCVRLAPDNIELLYAMLTAGQSQVTIRE